MSCAISVLILDFAGTDSTITIPLFLLSAQVRGLTDHPRGSGQGQDRTADLPLFRRTLIPTELPDLLGHEENNGLAAGRPADRAVLTGFEPATSTLTGWRALLAALQDQAA